MLQNLSQRKVRVYCGVTAEICGLIIYLNLYIGSAVC